MNALHIYCSKTNDAHICKYVYTVLPQLSDPLGLRNVQIIKKSKPIHLYTQPCPNTLIEQILDKIHFYCLDNQRFG